MLQSNWLSEWYSKFWPLSILESPWYDISLYYVEGSPTSKGFGVVLYVIDRLTKHAHFIPFAHTYIAVKVAQVFFCSSIQLSLAHFGGGFLVARDYFVFQLCLSSIKRWID